MNKEQFVTKLKQLDISGKSTIELYNEISAFAMSCGLNNVEKPAIKNA